VEGLDTKMVSPMYPWLPNGVKKKHNFVDVWPTHSSGLLSIGSLNFCLATLIVGSHDIVLPLTETEGR
jgi:hypothetical protein